MDFSWCRGNLASDSPNGLFCKNLKCMILFMVLDKQSEAFQLLSQHSGLLSLESLEISLLYPKKEDEIECESEIVEISSIYRQFPQLECFTIFLGYLKELEMGSAHLLAETLSKYCQQTDSCRLKAYNLLFSNQLLSKQQCIEMANTFAAIKCINSLTFRCVK